MANHVIPFPARRSYAPVRSHDSLARDTSFHAHRIAQQVEKELERKAQRLSVGLRIEFADAPRAAVAMHTNVFIMPAPPTLIIPTSVQKTLSALRASFTNLFRF